MKVVMIMPGYGSQFLGMAKDLYDNYRIVQEYFEEAGQCLDTNFVKLCFASSENELAKLHHAYTSLFLVHTSIAAVLASEEIPVSLFMGYNTGDFSALATAGGISLPDGLYLLNKYAHFYQDFLDTNPSNIIRIKTSDKKIKPVISTLDSSDASSVALSHYFNREEIAVSGPSKSIDELMRYCNNNEIAYDEYELGNELHSTYAQSIADALQPYLTKVDFKPLATPVMRSMDGKFIQTPEEASQTVIDRITHPAHFDILLDALASADIIVHSGLEDRLTALITQTYPTKPLITLNQRSDIMLVKNMIQDPETVDVIKE